MCRSENTEILVYKHFRVGYIDLPVEKNKINYPLCKEYSMALQGNMYISTIHDSRCFGI